MTFQSDFLSYPLLVFPLLFQKCHSLIRFLLRIFLSIFPLPSGSLPHYFAVFYISLIFSLFSPLHPFSISSCPDTTRFHPAVTIPSSTPDMISTAYCLNGARKSGSSRCSFPHSGHFKRRIR